MKASTCPNHFPTRPGTRRIAILTDAPGTHELSWVTCSKCAHAFASEHRDTRGTVQSWTRCERCGCEDIASTPIPLVGPSGRLLNKLLDEVGIRRDECFIGHVAQVQPPRDEIARFKWEGEEIRAGLETLQRDLATYQPHFILCLGGAALKAMRGKGPGVDDYRGYLFETRDTFPGVKSLATFSPMRILRESGLIAYMRFDLQKVARECRTDTIDVPVRNIEIGQSREEIVARLQQMQTSRTRVALDIEGSINGIACVGFATDAHNAYVVPLITVDYESVWSEDDEIAIMDALRDILEDPLVPKIIQNALYELFVLAWSVGIVIRGLTDDTMLKHFELYCELEKSLEVQASIYVPTQPWWKLTHRQVGGHYVPFRDGRRVTSHEWYIYNGTDCCVTYACDEAQERQLKPRQREHYRFNVSLLTPLLYMELRGMKYDYEEAQKHKEGVDQRIYALQDQVNREAVTGGQRPELANFFAGCGSLGLGIRVERDVLAVGPSDGTSDTGAESRNRLTSILPFLTNAFCAARRTEKREVEEVSWQPMRWNGKKWVKAGKRVRERPEGQEIESLDSGRVISGPNETVWKPIVKLVERAIPVPITSLADVRRFAKDSVKDECRRACRIVDASLTGPMSPAACGELATLLGLSVKVSASGRDQDEEDAETGDLIRGDERDANWYLYTHCALPKQYVKEKGRLTDRLASDAEAVIKAWIASGKSEETRDDRALVFAELKKLLTEARNLKARPDDDGRIRSSYNVVGTKTHRLSNSGSPTRTSRLNLQTITKSHRRFYRADDGMVMCQRDLAGADGWTVAAYAAMLDDPNMLEDYRAKLKPAQIGVLMWQRGPEVNALSRDALKPLCEVITEESTEWEYFAFKRVQHMSSYLGGIRTMANQILTDSVKKGGGKPVYVSEKVCEQIQQRCFFVRYPGIVRWHRWMERVLKEEGALTASNGFTRRFYGRKDDRVTIGDALAHLPQVYTTYATTLALSRLWTDPTNRRPDGSCIIEPLHTVHDSLVTQWPVEVTEWARERMKEWFNNPIEIARTTLVIPASGTLGPSWGEQEAKL